MADNLRELVASTAGAGTPAVAVPHQGESQTAGSYPDQDLRMVAIEAVRVKGACSHGTAVPLRSTLDEGLGRSALPPLGLDTRRRTRYGRTRHE